MRAAHKEELRIVIETPTDYAWPYVAVLQERTGKHWQEIDAWGGDTAAEARATLRAENRRARKVPHD